jgi:hypothetical protein
MSPIAGHASPKNALRIDLRIDAGHKMPTAGATTSEEAQVAPAERSTAD